MPLPASQVLDGVGSLRHLSLKHYHHALLAELPRSVVATLRAIEVTPRPTARFSHFDLRLPPGMALEHLALHGSYYGIASTQAAPQLDFDIASFCVCCATLRAEARLVTFHLPPEAPARWHHHRGRPPAGWEVEVAAALLSHGGYADGRGSPSGSSGRDASSSSRSSSSSSANHGKGGSGWRRLELWVLEDMQVELPSAAGPAAQLPRATAALDLPALAAAISALSKGSVSVQLYTSVPISIFHATGLVLERQGALRGL